MPGKIAFFTSQKLSGFNRAITPTIVMAQIFGVMPLHHLLKYDVMLLEFKFKSWRSAYSIFCIIGTFLNSMSALKLAYDSDFDISQLSPFIFYALNVYIMIEFFKLAQHWPRLMRHWERVESAIVHNNRAQKLRKSLSYRLSVMTIVVMIGCWTEHLLSIVSALLNMCDNVSYDDFLRGHLSHLFVVLPYNHPTVVIGKFFNIISTFAWNFMDLFVILNSIGIANTFKQLSDFICHEGRNQTSAKFWARQHRIYQKMVDLLNELDDLTCSINLVSFSNNVYFIIFQLLNSLQSLPLAHAFYFWFSLIFLISRTILISLCAAEIQDQARRPLIALRKIKSEHWSEELRRFSEEITNARIGLTGKKLFFINRSLLLSVAGTIITYELVLIQFKNKKNDMPVIEPCNTTIANITKTITNLMTTPSTIEP